MRSTPKDLTKLFSFLLVILTISGKSSGQKVGESCDSHLGTLGVCKPARDCSHAVRDLYDGVELAKCSYVPKLFVICCLENAPTEEQAGRPRNKSESISRKKCDEYAKPTYTEYYRSGFSNSSTPVLERTSNCITTIADGYLDARIVKIGEFPHMAAIGWRTTNKNRLYDFKCVGSLISDKFVLTVAHCNSKDGSAPVIVRLGDHNIKSTDDRVQELDVDIKKIIVHEKYDNVKKVNDIALIELGETVTFTDKIRPACLWQDDEVVPKVRVIAAGWGDTDANVKFYEDSDDLMKNELEITPQDECRKSWWDNFRVRVDNANICAGTPTGGEDSCHGDSGGPLMVKKEENFCLHYIVGLTSAGTAECGKKGYYGLYTRVPSYLDWIENIVWK